MKRFKFILLLSVLTFTLSCDESLPPRIVPTDTLRIVDVFATEGTDMGGFMMTIMIVGENLYDDTFQDTVSMGGYVHIYWRRKPEHEVHLPLYNNNFTMDTDFEGRILTVDPGDKFYFKSVWHFRTDDGTNLMNLFDYAENPDPGGYLHADPETFVIEVKAEIFSQVGYIYSDPIELTVHPWKKVTLGKR